VLGGDVIAPPVCIYYLMPAFRDNENKLCIMVLYSPTITSYSSTLYRIVSYSLELNCHIALYCKIVRLL
jgi:hypothetical protein